MQIRYLLQNLPAGLLLRQTLREPDADIAEIARWPAAQPEPDVLYLASEPPEVCPDNIACFSACDAKNAVLLAPDVSLDAVVAELRRVLLADRRTVVRVQKALRAFLKGRGLQPFIEEAVRIFGNPIFVIDTSCHYIASFIGDAPQSETLLQTAQAQRVFPAVQDRALDAQLADGQVVVHVNEALGLPTLLMSLRVHSIEVGHLVMVASNRPIESGDFTGFQMVGKMVALELQTSEVFQLGSSASSYFLIDLLNDQHPTAARVAQRLQYLPFSPQGAYFLAVVDASRHDLNAQHLRALDFQLGNLFQGILRAQYENQLILLFSQPPDAPIPSGVLDSLQSLAARDCLVVGVSNPFSDLTALRHYYQQARTAIKLGQTFPKPNARRPVFAYETYAFIDMLNVCEQSGQLLDYCHPALLRLLHHDEHNHSDLMNTLYEYLRCGCSTQQAAKALFIHKNTLLYRLDRIREILDNDLSDPWDQLLFNLSFRILFHLNLYRSTRLKKAYSESES